MLTVDYIINLKRATLEPEMLPGGEINPHALACCLREAAEFGILPPSVSAFQAILEESEGLVDTLNEYYPDDGVDIYAGYLDTNDREVMLGIISDHFEAGMVPRFMHSDAEIEDFEGRLKASMEAQGWKYEVDGEGDTPANGPK